jgi:hypothetical protein
MAGIADIKRTNKTEKITTFLVIASSFFYAGPPTPHQIKKAQAAVRKNASLLDFVVWYAVVPLPYFACPKVLSHF